MLFVVVLFCIGAIALLSWAWSKGSSNVKENRSNENFLHTSSGRDLWDEYDEDCIHTEGEI